MENIQLMGYAFDPELAMNWGVKIAWIIAIIIGAKLLASGVSWSFAKLIDRIPLLQRAGGDGQSVGHSLGKILGLLVWLFAWILILQRLGFQSAIQPIQGLLDGIFAYVPRIVGAGLVFFIGLKVVGIVKEIVETSLGTVNLDKWAAKGGVEQLTGNSSISKTIATVIYVLLIVPVAIFALGILDVPTITVPAQSMLNMVLQAVPLIIGASLLLGLGFFIARWISNLLTTILPDLGADRAIDELGILPKGRSASGIIATIVSIAIMIFFAIAATNMLGFPQLTEMLSTVLDQAGSVVFGAVLIAFGVIIARLLSNLIEAATGEGLAPTAAYYLTIGLFIFIGIKQMNIGGPIVDYAFGALAIGSAVAFALAFGLGGREAAAKLLSDMQSQPPRAPAAKPAAAKPAARKPVAKK
jgi:hypothetical protein